jgi:hypothetical protein
MPVYIHGKYYNSFDINLEASVWEYREYCLNKKPEDLPRAELFLELYSQAEKKYDTYQRNHSGVISLQRNHSSLRAITNEYLSLARRNGLTEVPMMKKDAFKSWIKAFRAMEKELRRFTKEAAKRGISLQDLMLEMMEEGN